MRSKNGLICFSALILAVAAARADDTETQKRRQTQMAAPVSSSNAPHVDLEAQKPRQNPAAWPASPSPTPRTYLEGLNKGVTAPASRADAPSVDLEKLKRPAPISVTKAVSRSLEEKTQRVSQAAIATIPLQRSSDPYGSSIPPTLLPIPAGRP